MSQPSGLPNHKKHLKDKVIVITGASSGVGRAAAKEFAVHGVYTGAW